MLKQQTDNTMDAPTDLMFYGWWGSGHREWPCWREVARIEEQIMNIAIFPLPTLNHNTYLQRFYRGSSVQCRVCGTRRRVSKMVLCDKCRQGYQHWCLNKPLLRVPKGAWMCPKHSGMPLPNTLPHTLLNVLGDILI